MGRVSYGMYVFHWAIYVYVIHRIYSSEHLAIKLLLFIPFLLVTYGFSEVSYRLYESKFLVLKEKFFQKKTSKKTDVATISH